MDSESKSMAILATILIVVIVALSFFGFGFNALLFPKKLEIERNAVQQSKSFNDSQIQQALNLQTEFAKLDIRNPGDDAHKAAVRSQICYILVRVEPAAIPTSLNRWKAETGGCQ